MLLLLLVVGQSQPTIFFFYDCRTKHTSHQ